MNKSCNNDSIYTLIQKLVKEYKISEDHSSLLAFIGAIRYKKIRHYYLPIFISALCQLDSEIYIEYEITTEKDWDQIQHEYDTPLETNELLNLKKDIQTFNVAYVGLRRFIRNIKPELILKCFDDFIVPSATRNVQYLLFDLCERNYDIVFKHIIENIQCGQMSSYYIPVFSTLLVRYKNIKESDQEILLKWFYKYVKKHKTLVNIQYFLYATIFFHKKEFIKKYLNFSDDLYLCFGDKINNSVSSMYANIYEKKELNSILRSDEDILKAFTFDSPIINKIQEIYSSEYVEFEP